MKKFLLVAAASGIIFTLANSCNKTKYTATDHTVGLTNATRSWTGYTTGFIKGDTLDPAPTHVTGALYFYHAINDTSFSILKVNGFMVGLLGTDMSYSSTDSVTHIVEFDTTFPGSPKSFVKFNYLTNVVNVEYHWIGTYNAVTSRYYETDIVLQSN